MDPNPTSAREVGYGLWRCVKVSRGHIAALPMTFTSPCEQGICDWVHSSGSLTVCVQADTWMCAGIYMAFFLRNVVHSKVSQCQPFSFMSISDFMSPTFPGMPTQTRAKTKVVHLQLTRILNLPHLTRIVRGAWRVMALNCIDDLIPRHVAPRIWGYHSAKLQLQHPLHHQQLGESRNQ